MVFVFAFVTWLQWNNLNDPLLDLYVEPRVQVCMHLKVDHNPRLYQ